MPAANPVRGEAQIGSIKIVVDFNAWCALEAKLGMFVPEILGLMDKGLGFSQLRTILTVFAVGDVTEEDVGEQIGEIGYPEALRLLGEANNGFFRPEMGAGKDSDENPRKAA